MAGFGQIVTVIVIEHLYSGTRRFRGAPNPSHCYH